VAATFPAWAEIRLFSFSSTVTVKIVNTAYVVGVDYANVGLIPVVAQSQVTDVVGQTAPLLAGGVVLVNPADGANETTPNITAYQALVAADAAGPSSYSLSPRASKPVRYMGNIWIRRAYYVKAL
jgi:hypothetical protein